MIEAFGRCQRHAVGVLIVIVGVRPGAKATTAYRRRPAFTHGRSEHSDEGDTRVEEVRSYLLFERCASLIRRKA
jgi:hypothetical protein